MNDWTWFSRFGALVVVCGLLLAKWDFEKAIRMNELVFFDDIVNEVEELEDEDTKELVAKAATIVKEKFKREKVQEFKPQYVKTEVYIVGVGTLIWGFGDLVQRLFT